MNWLDELFFWNCHTERSESPTIYEAVSVGPTPVLNESAVDAFEDFFAERLEKRKSEVGAYVFFTYVSKLGFLNNICLLLQITFEIFVYIFN